MRFTARPWFTALIVVVGTGFAMLTLARGAQAARPSAAPRAAVSRSLEPHPEIRRAIEALERAKAHLQHAAHDFGGHRVEAIEAIDRALQQLHQALQFDK